MPSAAFTLRHGTRGTPGNLGCCVDRLAGAGPPFAVHQIRLDQAAADLAFALWLELMLRWRATKPAMLPRGARVVRLTVLAPGEYGVALRRLRRTLQRTIVASSRN